MVDFDLLGETLYYGLAELFLPYVPCLWDDYCPFYDGAKDEFFILSWILR